MGPIRPVDILYCRETRIKTDVGAMWRRTLFFWLDALQISAGERRIMLTLMTLIVGVTGFSVFSPDRAVYDQGYYEPVMEEFRRLSKVEAQNERKVMARYYPSKADQGGKSDNKEPAEHAAGMSLVSAGGSSKYAPLLTDSSDVSRDETGRGEMHRDNENDPDTTGRKDDQPGADKEKDDQERKEIAPVNIQSAGKEELMTLPGIGPVTAERILDYRNEHGRFEHPEALLEVSGIGPVTLDNIRKHLVVE